MLLKQDTISEFQTPCSNSPIDASFTLTKFIIDIKKFHVTLYKITFVNKI